MFTQTDIPFPSGVSLSKAKDVKLDGFKWFFFFLCDGFSLSMSTTQGRNSTEEETTICSQLGTGPCWEDSLVT